jgi:hypothetical protein
MIRLSPLFVGCILALAGCFVGTPPPAVKPLAADGPIARVRPGMATREVEQLLGAPDATREYVTAKALPFSVGGDTYEVVYHYRSVGRIVFGKGPGVPSPRVVRVEGDRYETGVAQADAAPPAPPD